MIWSIVCCCHCATSSCFVFWGLGLTVSPGERKLPITHKSDSIFGYLVSYWVCENDFAKILRLDVFPPVLGNILRRQAGAKAKGSALRDNVVGINLLIFYLLSALFGSRWRRQPPTPQKPTLAHSAEHPEPTARSFAMKIRAMSTLLLFTHLASAEMDIGRVKRRQVTPERKCPRRRTTVPFCSCVLQTCFFPQTFDNEKRVQGGEEQGDEEISRVSLSRRVRCGVPIHLRAFLSTYMRDLLTSAPCTAELLSPSLSRSRFPPSRRKHPKALRRAGAARAPGRTALPSSRRQRPLPRRRSQRRRQRCPRTRSPRAAAPPRNRAGPCRSRPPR